MMRHPISETDLLEYVDGTCSPCGREKIALHMEGCASCRNTAQNLRFWRVSLSEAAGAWRAGHAVTEETIDRMLADSRVRIAQAETAGEWTPAQAVVLLRSVLEPFCGIGTAKAAVAIALRRSGSAGVGSGGLDRSCWNLFIENLTESVESVCGRAAGRLVGQAGSTLAVWGRA